MASETRRSSQTRLVFSDVHENRPYTDCCLCKQTNVKYTHPVKWKNEDLVGFLKSIEPDLIIQPDSCICSNCRNSLAKGYKDPENYYPRWKKESGLTVEMCDISGCNESVYKSTQLASRGVICKHLECSMKTSLTDDTASTHLFEQHYHSLHKKLNLDTYQWRCVVCSAGIRGSNYSSFRSCSEPEMLEARMTKRVKRRRKMCQIMECQTKSLSPELNLVLYDELSVKENEPTEDD